MERGTSIPGRALRALAVCLALAWARGARHDVELRRVDIAGTPFFRVASIGGVAAP
jgi:hypothetical protein